MERRVCIRKFSDDNYGSSPGDDEDLYVNRSCCVLNTMRLVVGPLIACTPRQK